MRSPPRPVHAVLFDLDGTLVDSEIHTDQSISGVLAQYGLEDFRLPHTETHGRTWLHIADKIRERTKIDRASTLIAADLLAHWNDVAIDIKPIPGARKPCAPRQRAISGSASCRRARVR